MKTIFTAVSASAFLLASGLSFAGEPVNLNADQMDQVNAGAVVITISNGTAGAASGLAAASTSNASHSLLGGLYYATSGSLATSPVGNVATNASNSIRIAF